MNRPRATLALFQGPGRPFEFREAPLPDHLAPGELLVAISLATICGSDLHTFAGRRAEAIPSVPGHEGVGRVVAAGTGRESTLVGRRITWTLTDSCGQCRPCQDWGLPQKCERMFKYGHAGFDADRPLNGCYATHLVLRAGTTVVPLPDSVTDIMAAPANCALATMIAATEELAGSGDLAVIQGAGLLGLFGCALLKRQGWRRVVVADLRGDRLRLVPDLGGEPAPGSAREVVESGRVDVVIEVAGRPEVTAEGIELLRPGGRYHWVGMVHPETRLELTGESVVRKCLSIHGTHNYTPRHLERAVAFLEQHGSALPWERLVSAPLPLAELDRAVQLAGSGSWPRVAVRPVVET